MAAGRFRTYVLTLIVATLLASAVAASSAAEEAPTTARAAVDMSIGAPSGVVGPQGVVELQVAGRGGVPSSADAVVLNVTATQTTAESFVTVWPTGTARPNASNLNFVASETRPNLVISKLGVGGKVSLYNHAGSTHLLADVAGFFPAGSGYRSLNPSRQLDTRVGLGGQRAAVGAKGVVELGVTGRGGVPSDGVEAVVLNVTAADATAESFVTVWPTGVPRPNASNLNVVAGETRPNLVISKVGADGKVSLYNHKGTTHLLADVSGYFKEGGDYVAMNPIRLLDTRDSVAVGPRGVVDVQPQPYSGVAAVVMNVTATQPTAESFVTAYPSSVARPNASNLNMAPDATTPNLVISKLGADGRVLLYNHEGYTHLIADAAGFFPTGGSYRPLNPTRLLDTRPPAAPSPSPAPPIPRIAPGTQLVGVDISPGRYIADGVSSCYWERLSGLGGSFDEIIANDFLSGRGIVDIAATDVAFKSNRCGTWIGVASSTGPPRNAMGPGAWQVGVEITPGRWATDGAVNDCYWERLSGFSGESDQLLANDLISGRVVVDIASTDVGFSSTRCGNWTRIG